VGALELAHRARGDRAVDAVGDELGLDLVEQVEVHLQRGHGGAGRAHGERAVLGGGRLARDERGRGAVAGVALDAEQALDGQRRSAQRGRRRERGDGFLRGLGRGSLRGVLAHGRQASPTRATRSSTRVPLMTTVREATFDFLRRQGMTTVFGNPGSTELPFLEQFPDDFRYVLGLHEGVAVGVADGFAQASGRPALVNLHTAPGVGNGMGAMFNAQANKSPLVITAGQQARSLMTLQALLTNRDAARMPHPLVKWSYEPPRAEDVPHAIARATHLAALPPRGPVFVSIPMDDWRAEVDEDATGHQLAATSAAARAPTRSGWPSSRGGSPRPTNPVLVVGPDADASGAWDAAVELAERARLPVWAPPATGGGRIGFPRTTRTSAACCRPRSGPLADTLAGTT
jgi:hypothetical protein